MQTCRKAHQLVGFIFMVFLVGILNPASVDAHASLLSTTPEEGAHLEGSPTEIVLEFSEPVGLVQDGTILHRSEGDPVTLSPETRGSSVVVPFDEPLGDGAYIVQWRVLSADSHPIAGTISFTIGDAETASVTAVETSVPAWIEWARAIATAVKYAGLLTALGLLIVGWRLIPADLQPTLRWTSLFSAVALVGVVTELPFGAMVQQGIVPTSLSGLWTAVSGLDIVTTIGAIVCVSLLSVVIAGRKFFQGWVIPVSLLLAANFTLIMSGHTQSKDPMWLMVISDAVHVVVGAVWIGGILLLTLGLRDKWGGVGFQSVEAKFSGVSRFSSLASYSAAIIIASGVVMAITIFDGFDAVFRTDYGVTLLIKIGLVCLVLLIAAVNRFWLIPKQMSETELSMRWLARLVSIELVFLVMIVGVTGSLVQRDPNVQAEISSPSAIFDQQVTLDDDHNLIIQITQDSNHSIEVIAKVVDENGATVVPNGALELNWYLPERDLGPITQSIEIDSVTAEYQGSISLPISGEWQLEVRAIIDRFTDSRTTIQVVIPD